MTSKEKPINYISANGPLDLLTRKLVVSPSNNGVNRTALLSILTIIGSISSKKRLSTKLFRILFLSRFRMPLLPYP